ncbi:uncharacterized protein LOC126900936 isoform X2 [Daktulosphaira vitifoliae]|nr:uncharacterized protein LOC126900936 isoform X2 [Daktulosphaira vitifoliae]
MLRQVTVVILLSFSGLFAFEHSTSHESSHNSVSGYSKTSSHEGGRSYSYSKKTSHGPGYSYSYSYGTDHGSPLYFSEYAPHFHSYSSPLFIPDVLLDIELDHDLDTDLDFYIDTDLDLDLDLDFPGIEYGLGYVGKYGHLYRIPKYGHSRLYRNLDGHILNYGGR